MNWHEWFRRHRNRIRSIQPVVTLDGITLVGVLKMSATLNDLQSLPLSIEADDAAGSAVPLPAGATVAFTSDNPAVLAVTANVDGVTATGKAGTPGTANVIAVLTLPGAAGAAPQAFTSPALAVTVISSAIASIKVIAGTPA